ncbi:Hint domain-containing protein [Acidocella sp.]|uniref:Hint domain-containing protein n=1 Tax=Acidocella sp. TaxID=50710 RepID=UPI002617B055|nr:Hint domain-containing protein [Acidocella sp.]
MSGSSETSLVVTGGTLTVTAPYSVATNLEFENNGTASGVIVFSRTGITAGTATLDGTLTPVANFGGGIIENMLPGAYPGILGDQVVIQSVETLFNALDTAATAAADNADFGGHVTFAAESGNHILVIDGKAQMSAGTPFTLNPNEQTIVDEMMLGLFGTAANHGTLDISFAQRTNPNSNHPFIDAVVVADTPINPCFAAGTLILTTRGEVPVENLAAGDRLVTPSGGEEEIIWIGRREVDLAAALRPEAVRPVIIEPDALADGVPARPLRLSPDHALYLDGILVPAKALINWNSIRQDHAAARVTYYHIELPRHGALFAEAAAVESFLDTGHRGIFDNAAEAVIALPAAMQARREAESFAPLRTEGKEVEALRQRLAARQSGVRLAAPPL